MLDPWWFYKHLHFQKATLSYFVKTCIWCISAASKRMHFVTQWKCWPDINQELWTYVSMGAWWHRAEHAQQWNVIPLREGERTAAPTASFTHTSLEGGQEWSRVEASLLHGQWGISTAVGVVDNSVEGLVNPLPEHHSRSSPANTRAQWDFTDWTTILSPFTPQQSSMTIITLWL